MDQGILRQNGWYSRRQKNRKRYIVFCSPMVGVIICSGTAILVRVRFLSCELIWMRVYRKGA